MGNCGKRPELSSDLSGDFDVDKALWTLPARLPAYRRRLLHGLADEFSLFHISTGDQADVDGRRLHIARRRDALPGPCFVEGEEVEVEAMRAGQPPWRAIVVDPKINFRRQTVGVQYKDGNEADVYVQYVKPCTTSGVA